MSSPRLKPLADWVARFRFADVADRTELRLFTVLSDWSSALLAGLGHPLCDEYVEALLPFAGERGPSSVAGRRTKSPVAQAAMANAAISHFWEVDDAHRTSTSHPGITVVPTILAIAEAEPDIPLDRIRGAVVVGYEAVLRVGSYLGSEHYAVCHTTATAGTFGAAAAAAHLFGLDAERTLSAFGHAGTQAQGLWQLLDDGASEAKAFHGATAVRNGIAAATMARAGIPGAARILEGRRGMLKAWHLHGGDPDWLIPGDGLMIDTVTVKNWPTCGQMHSALDCADALHADGRVVPDSIAHVVIDVPKACLDIAGVRMPASVDEAKFSAVFCVAAALSGRRPDFRGLTAALVRDPIVRDLATRIELRLDPAFEARFPMERPARVTIRLTDGTERAQERSFRQGDPEAPWTRPALVVRAHDVLSLAGRPLDADGLLACCGRFADPAQGAWSPAELFSFSLPQKQPAVAGAL